MKLQFLKSSLCEKKHPELELYFLLFYFFFPPIWSWKENDNDNDIVIPLMTMTERDLKVRDTRLQTVLSPHIIGPWKYHQYTRVLSYAEPNTCV